MPKEDLLLKGAEVSSPDPQIGVVSWFLLFLTFFLFHQRTKNYITLHIHPLFRTFFALPLSFLLFPFNYCLCHPEPRVPMLSIPRGWQRRLWGQISNIYTRIKFARVREDVRVHSYTFFIRIQNRTVCALIPISQFYVMRFANIRDICRKFM